MEHSTTIGVDASDRTSKICVMRKMPDGEQIVRLAQRPEFKDMVEQARRRLRIANKRETSRTSF